jgi:hypothetical protein
VSREVEYGDQFEEWWHSLGQDDQDKVTAAVHALAENGTALGRPLADTIAGSRHQNMKELRAPASAIRVFLAFDPRRTADPPHWR